jgi:hypothetical protein
VYDPVKTIAPPGLVRWGIALRHRRNAPLAFTAMIRSHSSRVSSTVDQPLPHGRGVRQYIEATMMVDREGDQAVACVCVGHVGDGAHGARGRIPSGDGLTDAL